MKYNILKRLLDSPEYFSAQYGTVLTDKISAHPSGLSD